MMSRNNTNYDRHSFDRGWLEEDVKLKVRIDRDWGADNNEIRLDVMPGDNANINRYSSERG